MKTTQSEELEERFLQFGVNVIKLTQSLNNELPSSVINQVIRSSTSIGANYSEAQNASSRADFKNKIFISKKEASETRYWLRIVAELTNEESVRKLLDESQQILLILQKNHKHTERKICHMTHATSMPLATCYVPYGANS